MCPRVVAALVAEHAVQNRISSPPGWECALKRVFGDQRTSAVSMPSCECKGITDKPGTSPGRHCVALVGIRTLDRSPDANAAV